MERLSHTKVPPSPRAVNEGIRKSMVGNRGKNTKPEVLFRRELWKYGLRGYRLHVKTLPGQPDIIFTKNKLAVFVQGCYWHRCPYCQLPMPKTHSRYWIAKFQRNQERDKTNLKALLKLGWKAILIWECQIKKDVTKCVQRILRAGKN